MDGEIGAIWAAVGAGVTGLIAWLRQRSSDHRTITLAQFEQERADRELDRVRIRELEEREERWRDEARNDRDVAMGEIERVRSAASASAKKHENERRELEDRIRELEVEVARLTAKVVQYGGSLE